MKVRLAILENDEGYLKRIVTAFTIKYSDKLEIYSFTSEENALSSLEQSKIDVLIAGEAFHIDSSKLPSRCGFAYFVDNVGIETYRNEPAICKFQKAELIYKQILSIYSEKASGITGMSLDDSAMKIISFISVGGGTGSSTTAAACAYTMARRGKRVLYLNLEQFGISECYFLGDGQFNFGDVIYALKSQKSNLSIKLESAVRRDPSGVSFFASPKVALDMKELKTEDLKRLFSEIRILGYYDYIIVDSDFNFDKISLDIWKEAGTVVIVGDGEQISNTKFERFCQAFKIIEKQDELVRFDKAVFLYNKFSNKSGSTMKQGEITELGGIPRFEHASVKQVLEQMAGMNIFDRLF